VAALSELHDGQIIMSVPDFPPSGTDIFIHGKQSLDVEALLATT
jgi:hypothetical protein